MPKDPGLIVVHGLTDSEDGALAILERLTERGHSPVRLTDVPLLSITTCHQFESQEALHPGLLVLHAKWLHLYKPRTLRRPRHASWTDECPFLARRSPVKPVGLLHKERPMAADIAPVCSDIGRKYRCAELGRSTRSRYQ